jgi:iron complex transport system substrate-binding protein
VGLRRLVLACALLGAPAAMAAERVVTLAPHLAELVCAAGGCERLAGVVEYTDFPAEAAAKPKIGDAFTVNAEVVLSLKPDLILAWQGGTSPGLTARLEAIGIPVRAIAVRSLDDVARALEEVGALLGTRERAHAAAVAYRARLAALRRRFAGARPLRVLYQIEARPAFSVNRLSPISEAIEICGGVNVFAGMSQLSAAINPEALLAADADVVVFGKQDYVDQIRALWAQWPQARAQRLGHLYAVDSNLLERQSPRILDGIEELCAVLDAARR